ncbi:MAG: hypothetical protein KIT34_01385 [Cyanobacteria bacterium TGS_CYA1]|nr:hypothetical protein [Cyanobacteria bacterium TGS_CYA1]
MALTLGLVFLGAPVWVPAYAKAKSDSQTLSSSLSTEIYENWHDQKRNRDLPVKIYLPKSASNAPVVVFSHGLGGSREAALYLGKYWSEHGYVCIFVQHPGSDESIWKPKVESHEIKTFRGFLNALKDTLKDPSHAINRANDIPFIVDQLEQKAKPDSGSCLQGKIDTNNIAIAGHSFGSWTALTASGQKIIGPRGSVMTFADPRLKAAIYLSPTCPRKTVDPSVAFEDIALPGLHMTGTKDTSPIGETKIEDRRAAYDSITRADQYLVIINKADHMVFNGRPRKRNGDKVQQDIIARASTYFLDAYLKHSPDALKWLHEYAYQDLAKYGTFEQKTAKL